MCILKKAKSRGGTVAQPDIEVAIAVPVHKAEGPTIVEVIKATDVGDVDKRAVAAIEIADIAFLTAPGVTMGNLAWSSAFADIDNDGWEDLLIANGYLTNRRDDDL